MFPVACISAGCSHQMSAHRVMSIFGDDARHLQPEPVPNEHVLQALICSKRQSGLPADSKWEVHVKVSSFKSA